MGPGFQGPHFCVLDVVEGIEGIDVDDANARELNLEGMRIVFEVDNLESHILKLVELTRDEFLEAHDPDAMPVLKELLNLGKEIRVV